jgi:hypothetical protein
LAENNRRAKLGCWEDVGRYETTEQEPREMTLC